MMRKNSSHNYQEMAVINSIRRIYGNVFNNRIKQATIDIEAEESAGFRLGRSTMDHIFTLS